MRPQRNTFAAFVDSLASQLDDHEATGTDLAARVFLSRYHLDRLVVATAGETPGAAAPSRAAGAGRLPAADQRALHPRRRGRGRLLLPRGAHQRVLTGLLANPIGVARCDAPLASPTEDGLTVRAVLSRLIGQLGMSNAAVAMRTYDWSAEKAETLESMRARLAVEGPAFLEQVRAVAGADRMSDTFVDALLDPPWVFTYGGMIAHVLTFAAYRRTLVVGALDAAGIADLGWGDPMTWVAAGAG